MSLAQSRRYKTKGKVRFTPRSVDLHPILTMFLHIRIDPVWYGSKRRCQTSRPLQPGQFRMQTYATIGSKFGANQHTDNLISRAALVGQTRHSPAMLTEIYMETKLFDEDLLRFGTNEMPMFLMKNWHH